MQLLVVVAIVAAAANPLPQLQVEDFMGLDDKGGCEYSYNPSNRDLFAPIDSKLYRPVRSGHHFLYKPATEAADAGVEGSFGIQTRAK